MTPPFLRSSAVQELKSLGLKLGRPQFQLQYLLAVDPGVIAFTL
jgi:hypothetical protein